MRLAGVVDLGAHGDEAAVGVDLRLDGGDAPGELGVADLGRDGHRHADLDQPDVLLGHREVDPHAVEVLQRRVDGAGVDELADVDLRDADGAAERRLEALLVHHRGELDHLAAGAGGAGLGDVEVVDRGHAALAQLACALELGLGEVELGLGGGEVGALDGVVDLRQVLAGLHLVVGLEEDRLDDARGLDGELDPLRGAGGADGLEARLPGDGLDGGGGDGDRRRRACRRSSRRSSCRGRG